MPTNFYWFAVGERWIIRRYTRISPVRGTVYPRVLVTRCHTFHGALVSSPIAAVSPRALSRAISFAINLLVRSGHPLSPIYSPRPSITDRAGYSLSVISTFNPNSLLIVSPNAKRYTRRRRWRRCETHGHFRSLVFTRSTYFHVW